MPFPRQFHFGAVAAASLAALLAGCGVPSVSAAQPTVTDAYCDSLLSDDGSTQALDRSSCVARLMALSSEHDLRPYDLDRDGSLDVAEAIAAFGEPGDLLGSSGGEGASATATAIPRKTTTGAASPSVRTSPPAAEPSSQDRAPQDEPVFPDPPDEVPESMEWALYGPYPTMQTCEQAQAAWPSGTTECFIVDGQNYYHGMRQAFR